MPTPFTRPVDRAEVVARIRAHPVDGSPQEQRAAFARLVLGGDDPDPGATVRIPGDGADGTLVHLHGGGYGFGSPRTHARIAAGLAARTGMDTVLPAYPLAPEHPWPAQLDAALAAAADVDGPVVLSGDSAGGHLALVTALALSRHGHRPAGLLLFSPNTDRSGRSDSRRRNAASDPMVDDEGDRDLARRCFGDRPADDPQVSPLLDDLALLPPTYVEVGAGEILLDDSLLLARRAALAGVAITLHVEPQGLHMMQLWAPWWSLAAASLDRAARFVSDVTTRWRHAHPTPQTGGATHVRQH